MSDIGFTHIALSVSDVDKSISFYAKYADLKVVHRRVDPITSLDVAGSSGFMGISKANEKDRLII